MTNERASAVSTIEPDARAARVPAAPGDGQQHAAGIGVTFRETMSGYLALGEREPRLGARVARARGTMLRLRVAIEIPDLAAFLADPEHTGRLTGAVDTPSLGTLPGGHGVFRLFSPAPLTPHARLMVYELPIMLEGRQCYLAGEKYVVGGPTWRLWPETTTLLTRLHDGPSRKNEVIGAGVLRLGLGRIVSLLLTLRATGTDSTAERAGALLRFGRFFAGELGERYAPHLRPLRLASRH